MPFRLRFVSAFAWIAFIAVPARAQPPEPPEEAGPPAATRTAPTAPRSGAGVVFGGLAGNFPNLGVVGDFTVEGRSRGRDRADDRSIEMNVGAAVDPYFDLFADLLWAGEEIAAEEAYVTARLGPLSPAWLEPATRGLQARFGRMLLPFGHLGGIHVHAFPQVDAPGVVREFFGGESPKDVGGWLEYQAPWARRPTLSVLVGAYDGDGEGLGGDADGDGIPDGPFSGEAARGPLWLARVTSYLDWRDRRHALRVSGSLLSDLHDNAARTRTDIWSVEGKYRWTIDEAGRGFTLGGEYMRHHREENANVALPVNAGSNLTTEGGYVWAQYDHDRWWGVGYRFDRTDRLFSATNRTRSHAPYIEWRPTEFSRLRLQYRRDDRNFDLDGNGLLDDDEDRILAQGVFFIGWHPAHQF